MKSFQVLLGSTILFSILSMSAHASIRITCGEARYGNAGDFRITDDGSSPKVESLFKVGASDGQPIRTSVAEVLNAVHGDQIDEYDVHIAWGGHITSRSTNYRNDDDSESQSQDNVYHLRLDRSAPANSTVTIHTLEKAPWGCQAGCLSEKTVQAYPCSTEGDGILWPVVPGTVDLRCGEAGWVAGISHPCEAQPGALKTIAPDLTDIARNEKGDVLHMTQYEADSHCRSQGLRLPTARELALYSQSLGAQGVSKTGKDGYWLWKGSIDGKSDKFYFNPSGYQRPKGDLGNYSFWSSTVSSLHNKVWGDFFYALDGASGDLHHAYPTWGSEYYAVRCLRSR